MMTRRYHLCSKWCNNLVGGRRGAARPRLNGRLGKSALEGAGFPRTVHYEIEILRTFFRFAIKRNYLFANPMEHVEGLHLPKRSLPKFVTADELYLFFAACDPEERRVFSILFLSGMRRGELENLEWSDVAEWRPKTDERVPPSQRLSAQS